MIGDNDLRISRKLEHVQQALAIGQSQHQGLHDIRIVHNCLPESAYDRIALDTQIGDLKLSSPILINAMTGGVHETEKINRDLAIVARETGLAMAVGSQMSAIRNPEVAASYQIARKTNPSGILFANLGSEATLEQAQQAVEMIEADGLQIHLNVMQELIMPEGDRDFRGRIDRISRIVSDLKVPVIVKEVGFGIMKENALQLKEIGVKWLDVGGMGGTNFAAIENKRRSEPLDMLNDWGSPTSISLIEALTIYQYGSVIASGGITNALEATKALSLGASAVGIAGAFLKVLHHEGIEATILFVKQLHQGMMTLMTALGVAKIHELWQCPLVISGETAHWCQLRGIDISSFAQRIRSTT
jgi:isopentenyl-diphosphate delta-isomerase